MNIRWDQRGAGKSYSKNLTKADMHVENFITDVKELTNILRNWFHQDKIFLLGHSWGSALGFMAIKRHPELYHAYIAASEIVDWRRGKMISYDWTRTQARKENNPEAINALEEIYPFDPTNLTHLKVLQKWVWYYGGAVRNWDLYHTYMGYLGQGSEYYSWEDVYTWTQGLAWSQKTITAETVKVDYNLFRDLPEVQVPVYFFVGRYDYQTPFQLKEKWVLCSHLQIHKNWHVIFLGISL